MKTVELQRCDIDLIHYKDSDVKPSLDHVGRIVDEPCIIRDADAGTVMVYDELALDCAGIVAALKRVKYNTGTRSQGLVSRSAIFGYMPRITIRTDYCRATKMSTAQPREHKAIVDYADKVAEYYARHNPRLHEAHQQMTAEHVAEDYRIGHSPFTSGIANYNNALGYHFDTGNFSGVWSCMLVFTNGVEGGELVVPQYNLAFRFANNSIFMFDGQDILHGVAPILKLRRNAYRFTVVYYSLRQMWNCLPITEELLRIQRKRTEREDRLAKRIAGLSDDT